MRITGFQQKRLQMYLVSSCVVLHYGRNALDVKVSGEYSQSSGE